MEACRTIGGCPTGSAVVTPAGNLVAKYIFHAVGPIYGYYEDVPGLLQSAYQTCLDLVEQYHLESIAFPWLSTGAFGYPLTEAATIALRTIIEHLKIHTGLKQVTVVLFDHQAYEAYEVYWSDCSSEVGGSRTSSIGLSMENISPWREDEDTSADQVCRRRKKRVCTEVKYLSEFCAG